MSSCKAVDLRVRPALSADLSFPVGGVIMQMFTLLGDEVSSRDIGFLHLKLGETIDGDPSRLRWDSAQIYDYLNEGVLSPTARRSTLLATLRNAGEAADLDRVIAMRQNAYITSYSPSAQEEIQKVYYHDPSAPGTSRYRLFLNTEQAMEEMQAVFKWMYADRDWSGPRDYTESENTNRATQKSTDGTIDFEGTSHTINRGPEFRFPKKESEIKYYQAKAAIRRERLAAWQLREACVHGSTTFDNELETIDLNVRKFQAAYLDTTLVSPFDGIVSAIFRGPGEYVGAGEAVLRVESPRSIYLVGVVKYRGVLRLHDKLKVRTILAEAPGAEQVQIEAEVVTVQGHESVSEQWNIIARANNFNEEGQIFPLNYTFDFESTEITILSS